LAKTTAWAQAPQVSREPQAWRVQSKTHPLPVSPEGLPSLPEPPVSLAQPVS